ncbi:hypothetical protein ACJIZ3_011648 [Penstemon smallii]|uniref:Cullin N-terminal domain-containing protein n=1 Tax=Penstemon smallii TaxID=265156 RepID=A0ABD3ULW4_9LAMI
MKGSSSMEKRMTFDEAWPILQEEAINKVIDNLDGPQTNLFNSEEWMRFYTIVYDVRWRRTGGGPQILYDNYKKTFEDYISSKVLPSLKGKKNEDLLQELLRRWNNHKTMTRWLRRFFECIDRRLISPNFEKPISLVGTSHMTFYNLVYGEMNNQIIDAVKSLIDIELKGELEIDEAMVKQVLDIYMEIGNSSTEEDYYVKDFEEAMVNATTTALLYSKNANYLESITNEESYEDYMLKVGECSNLEKVIFSNYFKFRNKIKEIEEKSKLEKKDYQHEGLIKTILLT